MESGNTAARKAGAVYFLFMILGIYSEFFLPRFIVSGNAAATAGNIAAAELTYRAGILLGFVTHVVFIFLVVMLYKLFEDVDKSQALLMVLLVSVGVAVALANMLNRFAPLQLLSDAESMSAFTKPQLAAIVVPAQRQVISGFLMPLYFGEAPIIFRLLLKGAKVRQVSEAPPLHAG